MTKLPIADRTGVLGFHLFERLIADGSDALCVDNFFTRLAVELLDWQPKVGLEDGLQETIAYFHRIVERP